MRQLSTNHGTSIVFVVEFQALQKVFNGAYILVFLDLAVDRQELVGLDFLLTCRKIKVYVKPCDNLLLLHHVHTLLLGATHLFNLGKGWVQVKSAKAVAQIEHVHRLISVKVVDREGEFPLYNK